MSKVDLQALEPMLRSMTAKELHTLACMVDAAEDRRIKADHRKLVRAIKAHVRIGDRVYAPMQWYSWSQPSSGECYVRRIVKDGIYVGKPRSRQGAHKIYFCNVVRIYRGSELVFSTPRFLFSL